MKLAKVSDRLFPTFPSFIDNFFSRDLMDWNNSNFSVTNSTIPAVNIKENDESFLIEVAAPGMNRENGESRWRPTVNYLRTEGGER